MLHGAVSVRCISIWLPIIAPLHLAKHGEKMAKKMLTFIHIFHPASPLCGYHPGEMCGLA